jgi:hypothetical protein
LAQIFYFSKLFRDLSPVFFIIPTNPKKSKGTTKIRHCEKTSALSFHQPLVTFRQIWYNECNHIFEEDKIMKESCHFDLRLSEDLLRRLVVISEAEGRSPNNTMLLMLRNYIAYFERAKGKLDPAKLRAVDIEALTAPAEEKKSDG